MDWVCDVGHGRCVEKASLPCLSSATLYVAIHASALFFFFHVMYIILNAVLKQY